MKPVSSARHPVANRMHWNRPSSAALTTKRIGEAQRYMNSNGSVIPARIATKAAGTSMARTCERCSGLATLIKARTVPMVPNHLPKPSRLNLMEGSMAVIDAVLPSSAIKML